MTDAIIYATITLSVMKNEESKSNNIIPVIEFFDNAEKCFHIKSRMIRLYISRGIIPAPERDGKKAFYDLKKSKAWEYLEVTKKLQNLYNLSLDGIEDLIGKYRDQIEDLNSKLALIENMYNRPISGPKLVGSRIGYVLVRDRFLEKISKDVLYLKKLDINEIVEEVWGSSS